MAEGLELLGLLPADGSRARMPFHSYFDQLNLTPLFVDRPSRAPDPRHKVISSPRPTRSIISRAWAFLGFNVSDRRKLAIASFALVAPAVA
jgi:hypothetical protein